MSTTVSMRTVSSLEKCFWDDDLQQKNELTSLRIFRNQPACFQVVFKNIRKKLGDASKNPTYIKTAWGKGYYID